MDLRLDELLETMPTQLFLAPHQLPLLSKTVLERLHHRLVGELVVD
jgi:hypothetical protein